MLLFGWQIVGIYITTKLSKQHTGRTLANDDCSHLIQLCNYVRSQNFYCLVLVVVTEAQDIPCTLSYMLIRIVISVKTIVASRIPVQINKAFSIRDIITMGKVTDFLRSSGETIHFVLDL